MEKVLVLLSSYNGEKYIDAQIQSLLHQKGVNVEIIVRDDGSNDSTQIILDSYQKQGVLKWYTGDNLRPAKSFMNLLQSAPERDYYAFCDQDDVWDSDKLRVAIDSLGCSARPALYCSNTMMVDVDLNEIECSDNYEVTSFVSSLISNPVTGCTAVFNRELKELVCSYIPTYIDMHDWWVYRICMAVDGVFVFDKQPHIRYRQHGGNVIGGLSSSHNVRKRHFRALKNKDDGPRYQIVRELYNGYLHLLPKHNAFILEQVYNYKNSLSTKMKWLLSGLKSIHGFRYKINFALAVILNKF